MISEVVTKRKAAKFQLETAIKLFFENRDQLSAYTLACVAEDLMEGIYQHEKDSLMREQWASQQEKNKTKPEFFFSMAENLEIAIKPEHLKEARKIFNKKQNFLKHADNDPSDTIEFKGFEDTELVLFGACWNYTILFKERSDAVVLFNGWLFSRYPDWLKAEALEEKTVSQFIQTFQKTLSEAGTEATLSRLYDMLKMLDPSLFLKSDSERFETLNVDRRFIEENFSGALKTIKKA